MGPIQMKRLQPHDRAIVAMRFQARGSCHIIRLAHLDNAIDTACFSHKMKTSLTEGGFLAAAGLTGGNGHSFALGRREVSVGARRLPAAAQLFEDFRHVLLQMLFFEHVVGEFVADQETQPAIG